MRADEHYHQAERLATAAMKYLECGQAEASSASVMIALAQVHAALAIVPIGATLRPRPAPTGDAS